MFGLRVVEVNRFDSKRSLVRSEVLQEPAMELVLFRIFICDFVEVMVGTLIKIIDDTK